MRHLEQLAGVKEFNDANQNDKAEMIAWLLCLSDPRNGVSVAEILASFESLHLHRPNSTRIKDHFKKSYNIRTLKNGRYQTERDFSKKMEKILPEETDISDNVFDVDKLILPPFVSDQRREDLRKMTSVYARLFMLENSMRGMIEKVLEKEIGPNWWDKAANSTMKHKHAQRVEKEEKNKWAPTRSEFGPLYSIDWSDLITIIRKYENLFEKYIKDINFLHRYDDAGTFRNIVAHNGALRDENSFELIRIYYQNWVDQVSSAK